MTFLARGVWGSLPIVTISEPGPVWTIFSTSRRILRRSTSRFLSTLAATPEPSLTSPRRMCSVPTYSWLKRCASWLASCITLRARSVKRSYMAGVSEGPVLAPSRSAVFRRRPGHRLDGDGGERRAVIQVDVLHGVVGVVIAAAVDVVVLHEQHHGDAGVGEDLGVGVVQRAARVDGQAHLAAQLRVEGHFRDGLLVGAALTAAAALPLRAGVPDRRPGVP